MINNIVNNKGYTSMEVNLAGIIAATFTSMIIGSLWYSHIFFGIVWMECINKTPETLSSTKKVIIGSVVSSLLTAVGISLIFSLIGVHSLCTASCIGLVLGVLIVFPALLSDNLFCGFGIKLLMIQSGYRVVSILCMSLVLYLI